MNFAGLVPGDTPFKNLTEDPPPGVGPYVITESVPNRQFVMERRQDFADLGIPDIPTGHVDKITTEIIKNQSQQAQDVLDQRAGLHAGSASGGHQADGARGGRPRRFIEPQRYEEFTTSSTYYFFMNHNVPPFDDPEVRKAVNIGIDKVALAKLFAGELAPGCSFLPAGHARLRRGAGHDGLPVRRPERGA